MKNYYYFLGITPEATATEIKDAYRKLSKKFHPDTNNGDRFFEERFKEVQEAYSTLGDAEKKKSYDQKWHDFHRHTQTKLHMSINSIYDEVIKEEYEERLKKEKEIFRKKENDLKRERQEFMMSQLEITRKYKNGILITAGLLIVFAVIMIYTNHLSIAEKQNETGSKPENILPKEDIYLPKPKADSSITTQQKEKITALLKGYYSHLQMQDLDGGMAYFSNKVANFESLKSPEHQKIRKALENDLEDMEAVRFRFDPTTIKYSMKGNGRLGLSYDLRFYFKENRSSGFDQRDYLISIILDPELRIESYDEFVMETLPVK